MCICLLINRLEQYLINQTNCVVHLIQGRKYSILNQNQTSLCRCVTECVLWGWSNGGEKSVCNINSDKRT